MLSLFRDRNFVLWWLAGRISFVGDYALSAALPFYVYRVSGSALVTGSIFMAEMIPPIVLGSVAGVYVDRWDRQRSMVLTELVLAVVLLPLLAVRSGPAVWIVPIVALSEATAFQFVPPASSVLIPAIVGRDRLPSANALLAIGTNLSTVVGPPLGALVLGTLGLSGVVLVDVASYLAAAGMTYLISIQPEALTGPGQDHRARGTSFWREWIDGLRLVQSERWIAGLFAVRGTAMLAAGMIWVLLIAFIERVLHQGAIQYSWWLSLAAVGGIAGSLIFGGIARSWPPARVIVAGTVLAGLTWLAAAWFQSMTVLLALAPLGAIGSSIWTVSAQTMLQAGVEGRYLGRVVGAHGALSSFAVLLGLLAASLLGNGIGIVLLLGVAGFLQLAAGLIAGVMLPDGLPGRRLKWSRGSNT